MLLVSKFYRHAVAIDGVLSQSSDQVFDRYTYVYHSLPVKSATWATHLIAWRSRHIWDTPVFLNSRLRSAYHSIRLNKSYRMVCNIVTKKWYSGDRKNSKWTDLIDLIDGKWTDFASVTSDLFLRPRIWTCCCFQLWKDTQKTKLTSKMQNQDIWHQSSQSIRFICCFFCRRNFTFLLRCYTPFDSSWWDESNGMANVIESWKKLGCLKYGVITML